MNADNRRLVQASSLLRKRVQYGNEDEYSSSVNSISTESEEDGYGSNTISNKGLNNDGMMLGATRQKEKIAYIKNDFVWADNTHFVENSRLANKEYSWVIKKDDHYDKTKINDRKVVTKIQDKDKGLRSRPGR